MWAIVSVNNTVEDTKEVIRSSKSKTNRQCNGQSKNDERANNDFLNKTLHKKCNEQHEPH
jgi:hypothetical protein